MRFRMPCGPVRISLTKDRRATHTMGLTSSPLNGLITFLVGSSTPSVLLNAMDHGKSSRDSSGLHVITMRTIMSSVYTVSVGFRRNIMVCAVDESSSARYSIAGIAAARASLSCRPSLSLRGCRAGRRAGRAMWVTGRALPHGRLQAVAGPIAEILTAARGRRAALIDDIVVFCVCGGESIGYNKIGYFPTPWYERLYSRNYGQYCDARASANPVTGDKAGETHDQGNGWGRLGQGRHAADAPRRVSRRSHGRVLQVHGCLLRHEAAAVQGHPRREVHQRLYRVWAGDDKLLHGAHVQLRR
mmetsp:Transcript_3958/g.11374  ORF Transcript_3958/g.11374 Transcript_3958/m.11374 type:complete len:301 (+) Transcript_3958:60-962(+)